MPASSANPPERYVHFPGRERCDNCCLFRRRDTSREATGTAGHSGRGLDVTHRSRPSLRRSGDVGLAHSLLGAQGRSCGGERICAARRGSPARSLAPSVSPAATSVGQVPAGEGWWAATEPQSDVWDNPLLAHKARLHLVDKNVPGWSPTHHWGHVTGRPCPGRCQCCQAEAIVAMPFGTLVECLARPCQVCLAFRDARPRGVPVCLVALEGQLGAVDSPVFQAHHTWD